MWQYKLYLYTWQLGLQCSQNRICNFQCIQAVITLDVGWVLMHPLIQNAPYLPHYNTAHSYEVTLFVITNVETAEYLFIKSYIPWSQGYIFNVKYLSLFLKYFYLFIYFVWTWDEVWDITSKSSSGMTNRSRYLSIVSLHLCTSMHAVYSYMCHF